MKFEAKKVDIDLELVLLDGTEVSLKPKSQLSTDESKRIMKAWTKREEVDAEGLDKMDVFADELAVVYDRPPEWWSSNFDLGTLGEIIVYIAQAIGGVTKKDVSLN